MSKSKKWNTEKEVLAFYDLDDECLIAQFDTMRDILDYKNLEYSKKNYDVVAIEVYRGLAHPEHITRVLGSAMKVYLVDISDDE